MSKLSKLSVVEMNRSNETSYATSFVVNLSKKDTPETAIAQVDEQISQAREQILTKLFESRGIKVKWSN